MGIIDRFKRAKKTERKKLAKQPPIAEIGYLYSESDTEKEPLSELEAPDGLEKFRHMRTNDPIIGGLMLRIDMIFQAARYNLEGQNADFVQAQFDALPKGINSLLQDLASALTYGFSINEKVWEVRDGLVMLKDLPPRHQLTVSEFTAEFVKQESVAIPRSKCIHFVPIEICRNPLGMSLLRHIYKPYYYKSSIEAAEALGIDRDLGGLPIMQAPEGYDFTKAVSTNENYDPFVAATLTWAKQVVADIRKDSSQGVVMPFGWVLKILKGESGNTIDTTNIINRYNTEMAIGILQDFAIMGAFASTNNANVEAHINDFLNTCDSFLSLMAEVINQQLIPDICRFNGLYEYPKISFLKLRKEALDKLAGYLARLVNANIITPTTEIEKTVLQLIDMPFTKSGQKPNPAMQNKSAEKDPAKKPDEEDDEKDPKNPDDE